LLGSRRCGSRIHKSAESALKTAIMMNNGHSRTEILEKFLGNQDVSSWAEISNEISRVKALQHGPLPSTWDRFLQQISNGTAFLTFEYGIDGVSIEISKYARVLDFIYGSSTGRRIHFIAGEFTKHADSILKTDWGRGADYHDRWRSRSIARRK
jgi:hypothetical protein